MSRASRTLTVMSAFPGSLKKSGPDSSRTRDPSGPSGASAGRLLTASRAEAAYCGGLLAGGGLAGGGLAGAAFWSAGGGVALLLGLAIEPELSEGGAAAGALLWAGGAAAGSLLGD